MTFQDVISRLHKHSGLHKKDFAERINVSRQTLFNYMSGRTEPSFNEAVKIIRASGQKDLAIIDKFVNGRDQERNS